MVPLAAVRVKFSVALKPPTVTLPPVPVPLATPKPMMLPLVKAVANGPMGLPLATLYLEAVNKLPSPAKYWVLCARDVLTRARMARTAAPTRVANRVIRKLATLMFIKNIPVSRVDSLCPRVPFRLVCPGVLTPSRDIVVTRGTVFPTVR